MSSHSDLLVWQKSIDLVLNVYKITKDFPEDERYGLTSQIRRSAVSIPSNIAEGHGRKSNPELVRFLKIAFGSSSELETQLLIAEKLGFLTNETYSSVNQELTEIRKILNKFISTIAANL